MEGGRGCTAGAGEADVRLILCCSGPSITCGIQQAVSTWHEDHYPFGPGTELKPGAYIIYIFRKNQSV